MDTLLFNFIHQFAGKFSILDLLGVFFAKYIAYILVIMWVILFFKEKGFKKRLYFFSLMALSTILSRGIITEAVRFFYNRPRPFISLNFEPLLSNGSYSFPSGHMTFYFAMFMAVFYIVKSRNVVWWFFGMTVLMGLSRIYCGIHWPSDILGGAIIGILSAMFVYWILPKEENQKTD